MRSFTKVSLILLFFTSVNAYGQTEWQRYDSYTSSNLNSVFSSGTAIEDGNNLLDHTSPFFSRFNGNIQFLDSDPNIGFAFGYHRAFGKVFKTTDAGITWEEIGKLFSVIFYGGYAIDENNIIAVGQAGNLMHTTDGGSSWTTQNLGGADLLEATFTTYEQGIILGDAGNIYRTNNGGSSWNNETLAPEHPSSECISNTFFGFICCEKGTEGNSAGNTIFNEPDEDASGKNSYAALLGDELIGNYPNPFNPSTTIAYRLNKQSQVTLQVFDITGRSIATLLKGETLSAGTHSINWNAIQSPGVQAGSGVYIYRLTVDGVSHTKRMMLVR